MDLCLGRLGQSTLCQRRHRKPHCPNVRDLSRVMTGISVEVQLGHPIKDMDIVKERADFRPHSSEVDARKSERSRGKGYANFSEKGDHEIH